MKSGLHSHTARATGSFGSGGCSTAVTSLTIRRKRSPRSTRLALSAGPAGASNTRRTGSSLPPIDSGWISSDGLPDRDRRADLEHVRAEHEMVSRLQVIGVILHEGGAAVPSAITFMARTSATVFQSPSPAKPKPSSISRCGPRPGSCLRPCRSSNVSVKPLKPPSPRKARRPSSSRTP